MSSQPLNYDFVNHIAEQVITVGFPQIKRNLANQREIDCAQLVEDMHVWDARAEHRTASDGDLSTSQDLVELISMPQCQPKILSFSMQKRSPEDCYIQINRSRIGGIPLFDGGATSGEVQGKLVPLGEDGDIAVGYVNASGAGREANRLLEQRQNQNYKALVGISRHSEPGIAMINADSFTNPSGLPVLIVDATHEKSLISAADRNETAQVKVEFTTSTAQATNVEVRIAGSQSDASPIVVMTPKSSWWTSTAERCGGIACWLACVREVARSIPKRTVIFTANTGHELGHLGLDTFLTENPTLAQSARAWVHFGANFASKDGQLRIQYSNESLGNLMHNHLQSHEVSIGSEVDGSIRPGGEARNIFDCGGDYVSFLGSNRLFHHPTDRLANNVDFTMAMRIRDAAVNLVLELANDGA